MIIFCLQVTGGLFVLQDLVYQDLVVQSVKVTLSHVKDLVI